LSLHINGKLSKFTCFRTGDLHQPHLKRSSASNRPDIWQSS